MSVDPIVFCPSWKTEINQTELLAAPLVEAMRRQYEQRNADAALTDRELA